MAGRGLQQGSRIQVPVIDFAEPPLQAEIIISSSMTESLILHVLANAYIHARARTHSGYGGGTNFSLPLCTMKTSLLRIEVSGKS